MWFWPWGKKKDSCSKEKEIKPAPELELDISALNQRNYEIAMTKAERYQADIANLKLKDIHFTEKDYLPLTTLEKAFLKYVNKRSPKAFAQHWIYDEKIEYQSVLQKFLAQELITVSDENVLLLTTNGRRLTKDVRRSLLYDTSLEDAALSALDEGNFSKARKALKLNGRAESAMSQSAEIKFLSDADSPMELLYRKCFWIAEQVGMTNNTGRLIKRLTHEVDYDLLSIVDFDYYTLRTQCELKRYRSQGIEKYEIIGGDNACPVCRKMNGKRIPVDEASPGVNLPPFCYGCSCVIVPVVR